MVSGGGGGGDDDDDEAVGGVADVRRGLAAACLFFLLYCALQLRDGRFTRCTARSESEIRELCLCSSS